MNGNISNYVTGFFFGAATGAVVALLNAPQSGKKTRTQIRKEVTAARNRTQKAITKAQTRTMDKLDDIQDRIKEISDGAVEQTERFKLATQQVMGKPNASRRR